MVVKIGLGVFLSFIFETLIFDYRFLLKLSLKNNCFLNVSLVYFLIKRINKKIESTLSFVVLQITF